MMLKGLYAAAIAILLLGPLSAVAASKPSTTATAVMLLDINTASVSDLNALPGIGATRAAAIVASRPYTSTGDLVTKGIVSQSIFDKIKSTVTVSGGPAIAKAASSKVTKSPPPAQPKPTTEDVPPEPASLIDLNTATNGELVALPGIGTAKAAAVIAARPFVSVNDLVKKGIVSASVFAKIQPLVDVTSGGTTTTAPPPAKVSGGRQAEINRIQACGAQWRADKAAGRIASGQTWPQYWKGCNTRLKAKGQ